MRDFPERLVALQPFWGLWQLEEFIGEGSYGKVYRIKREEFGETYYAALKWICLPQNQSEIQSLRNEGYDDASIADHYASVIKAFQSEIVLMSKLRGHSHIVSFEDHLFEKRENELGWDILIRMELLESLPGFFKKDRAVRDVITLGCDICDALTLCAKYKIVHRDIKPDNIFVNENGDFKLGDFGVARQMEHTQTNMSRKGTPFFMAPEVYTGREADARADQYSLGLVMHRLLNAQQIPFAPAFDRILTHQEREEALLQRLRGEALPPPLQGSEKLKQIILKASNYQPKKRFAAPEEMKAALQQTLNERENQASLFKAASGQISSKRSSLRPEAAFKKGKKSKRDKKDKTGWVLGILVGLILLLTGTGIWLLLQTLDEDVPASFENTIPAVQTPVPSTARTPMPTATPVPTETVFVALTSTPTTLPTSTFTTIPTATTTTTTTATPTATTTIAPTFTPTPTAAPTSVSTSYTALVSDGTPLPDIPVSSESNFEYRIDEAGNAVITKYTGSETICHVPETLDGRTVVSIEGNRNKSVFEDCANLQNVLLPDTMQSIGQFAFSKCDSLVSVSLPESLISIGDSAFWRCKSLTSITIPDAVTYIGVSAFYECSSLQHVSLPQNLKRITWSPFSGCTALASIVCPDSVTCIGMDAFGGCTSLKNVKLPFDLETIGWAAFRNCNKLGSLALPEHVKSIEHEAFDGCTSLEYLYIPMSVEEIGTSDQGTLAFDTTTTLVCPENSYAEKYARENGLSYINGNYDTWKALVEKAEIHSSSPSPTATPTVTPTPAPTPAEELLASEHTYHFEGTRYNPESGRAWSISAFTGLIAQEIPAINQLIMENSPGGFLSPDYNYDWQLSTEAAAVSDSALFSEFEKDDRWYQMYIGPETAEDTMDDVLGLIGKTVFTLTISRKSDNAVMTKVNCVLDSFVYDIEWHNFKPMEQEIFFTPDNPVTITLPQDKIAYTHDGTTVIYEWLQSTDKVSYYELVSGADCTSVTFTPKASWDGTYIEPNVRKENEFGSSIPLGITYILKSDGSSPAQPKQATQPEESTVPVSSENNFEYRIDEAGNAVITKYTGSETICHVPATLDGRTVVSIEGNRSKSAFEDCANLQYVLLPDTIQSVGQFAFFKCDSLIGVSLPASLTSIEHSAFKDCTSLEDIVFPDAITFIGSSAFHGCLSLQDITLPRNLEKMQAMAFAYCTALTSVFCSDSLAYIDAGTFKGCTSLKKVTLPGNLDRIGLSAFRDCKELSSIALSEHIKVIEHAAFEGCEKLDYIYIPASVEKIGVGGDGTLAFDEATTLIGPENSCAEKYAKQYNLQYNVPISQEDNFQVRINADGNAVITKYLGSEAVCNVPEIMAGRKVVAIGANAFGNCTDLRYVLLPDTIKMIENYAFSDCASLIAVSLPKSLISIGNCSFVNCAALTNLSFPDTLTEIGSLAFGGCSSLQHVILPKGIKEIAESTFADCANLVSVTCQDSLTIIGYKAFDGCTSLKNLMLSKNLEKIGWAAFRGCRQLNSLALPDRLSTIEYAAFDGCPNLKYLYVPDSVEKIGVGADGTLAFESETTLICPEGSYAETYVQMYFLRHATGGYSIWNGIVEMAQNMDTSMGTTEAPLEYYTVLTSKRTYLYPGMDEEFEAMLRIPGQMLISAVPAGDGWLKTEYAGIPGYVTTNNLKAYDLDKEYTWKEFQTMVNNALKACENGEVLVPGPKHVAAYKNGDKAITMPDGVKLIIEGGSFESMLVTNGKIELRNVTVNCAIDERCAITVSIPSKERSLELLIDENSTIAATGQYASAIGTDYNNTPSVKNAILNYCIVNNGRIESDGGSGIGINNWSWGDNGEAQVYIENNGMILSSWWYGIDCGLCDQQELEIINRGSIESTGHSGIDIESGSFHITNESGAVIKGGFSSGAINAGNSYSDATVSGSISNAGELQNLVVDTSVDFLPMIVYEGNDLAVFVWLTQIVRDMDEILTMDETKEIAKELLKNIKNNSGYAFEKAVIRLWTGEKEFETELEQTVYLESSEM